MLYRKFLFLIAMLVCLTFSSVNVSAGDEVPGWATQAVSAPAPSYDKDVPAVVLYKEQTMNLNSDGMITTTTNYAVRLLKRDGKAFAEAHALYLQSSSKVRDLRAWLFRPGAPVKKYEKDAIVDAIVDADDIYNEYRVKKIDASDDADAGAVFAFQSVVEERPLFTQDSWSFQNRLPTLVSRYVLNLPSGWQATSVTFNRAEIKPTVAGTSYTWELRDLAPIPPEPDSPNVRTLAPSIHVNYFPGDAAAANRVFHSWEEVSQWSGGLQDPSVDLNDEIAAKARELTANAKTELERIRAIANYVQNLRYISVDIGVGKGNGYRPRPASLVFQRGYGDCKDKANLMRTMLKALKIEAYPVLIYSGDPMFVRAEWASPYQFNHCIIAVKVSAETNAPTVITHEKLGRLLIFDATDPFTQLGDLPDHEQGSLALVVAGSEGKLLQMPNLPPEFNRLERTAEAQLLPDGSLQGAIREQAFGQTASSYRARNRRLSASQFQTEMEEWLARRVTGAKLSKIAPADRISEGRFDLDMEFSAGSYAQIMQGRLMVFKPAFVGRLDQLTVIEGKRVHPVLLDASAYAETIKVKLPDGFIVDEMPEGEKLETPFGKYVITYEVKEGFLLMNRSLTINKSTLSADKYEALKDFFAQVRAAEQSPVVLMKK